LTRGANPPLSFPKEKPKKKHHKGKQHKQHGKHHKAKHRGRGASK
jgi:hypothetical protein